MLFTSREACIGKNCTRGLQYVAEGSNSKKRARGGTPLYKLYRYVQPQRVWFLCHFGLKTGIDFDHYGIKSGMVFKGTTGAYKRICLFNSKWIVAEREVSKIYHSSWMLSILEFVIDAKLNYDTTKVWKWVWILESRSENGCGKWVRIWRNRAAHPYQEFRGVPPSPPPREGTVFPNADWPAGRWIINKGA